MWMEGLNSVWRFLLQFTCIGACDGETNVRYVWQLARILCAALLPPTGQEGNIKFPPPPPIKLALFKS